MLANLVGGIMAARDGEVSHMALHAGLLGLGAYILLRLLPESEPPAPPADDMSDLVARLQQSVDGVAIEVERIGEGQRFMAQIVAKDAEAARPSQ